MLARCLSSVWFCDEIIIVDTGSTDNTMDIARSYGAKVYEHPWQNDFSIHRNQSISYAKSSWICIIDCDESFACDMSNFKDRLELVDPNIGGLVVRVNEKGEGRSDTSWLGIRFFRRSSGVHYKGIVHNKAVYQGGCAATDIVLNHYGYSLSPEKMKAKRARTETLLLKRISENARDHAAYYYMAQLKIGEKNYKEVIENGYRFFNTVPVGPEDFQYYSVMYFYMAWAYIHLGDGGAAASWALKGLEFWPNDIDLNYFMARLGFQARRDDWIYIYGNRYLEAIDKKNASIEDNGIRFVEPVDPEAWANRTVYCSNEQAVNQIKEFLGVLSD